jgi:hypothetical protein
MPKVIAFPEQRLALVERQRVREAIAEVQTGRVATTLTEICVGLPGQAGMALGHRLDRYLGFLDQFVQTSANDRVTLGVEDDPAFEVAGC